MINTNLIVKLISFFIILETELRDKKIIMPDKILRTRSAWDSLLIIKNEIASTMQILRNASRTRDNLLDRIFRKHEYHF